MYKGTITYEEPVMSIHLIHSSIYGLADRQLLQILPVHHLWNSSAPRKRNNSRFRLPIVLPLNH